MPEVRLEKIFRGFPFSCSSASFFYTLGMWNVLEVRLGETSLVLFSLFPFSSSVDLVTP